MHPRTVGAGVSRERMIRHAYQQLSRTHIIRR